MIVSSVSLARAIWLFNVMDLNPRGLYIYDRLFPWLVERYQFAKAPAHARDQDENAWAFLDGRFVTSANVPVDVSLRVYNDGVVADTHSSTDDSDEFLADLLTGSTQALGLAFTGSMVHRRSYVSELNLICKNSLVAINPKMLAFSRTLSEVSDTAYEPTMIGFGADPASQPTFRFERKANMPFSQHHYWSTAMLATEIHLRLLNELEELLIP